MITKHTLKVNDILSKRALLLSLRKRDVEELPKLTINSKGQYVYIDRDNTIPHA